MAAAQRQPGADLARLLDARLRDPGRIGRYGFFAVVDLLTRAGQTVRFRHDHTLKFHAGELRDLRRVELPATGPDAAPRSAYELTACFLGLTGSSGPVPIYLSELTVGDDDATALRRALLAPFHDQFYRLFYQAGRRCDLPRSFVAGAEDTWSRRLLAWLGVGTYPFRTLRPLTLLHLATLFASRVRSARGLSLALHHVLAPWLPPGATLAIEQFAGGWARLGPGSQMELGRPETIRLGHSTIIGTRCLDPAGTIRIHIGPLASASFTELAPGSSAFDALREIIALFLRSPLEVHLQLEVEGAASPPLGSFRLGQNFRLTAPGAARRRARFRLSDGASLDPGPF